MWGLMSFIRAKTLLKRNWTNNILYSALGFEAEPRGWNATFSPLRHLFSPIVFFYKSSNYLLRRVLLVLWGNWGEKQKRKRAWHDGKGKERAEASPPFLSSHRPPRAFYFSIIAIFIGIPSGSLCRGERSSNRFDVDRKLTRGVY